MINRLLQGEQGKKSDTRDDPSLAKDGMRRSLPVGGYLARLATFQESLHLQPIGKPVDPFIGRKVLRMHAEAVAALRVYMQLSRLLRVQPFLIERKALWSK